MKITAGSLAATTWMHEARRTRKVRWMYNGRTITDLVDNLEGPGKYIAYSNGEIELIPDDALVEVVSTTDRLQDSE